MRFIRVVLSFLCPTCTAPDHQHISVLVKSCDSYKCLNLFGWTKFDGNRLWRGNKGTSDGYPRRRLIYLALSQTLSDATHAHFMVSNRAKMFGQQSWSQMSLHIYCTLFDIIPGKLSVEVEYRIPSKESIRLKSPFSASWPSKLLPRQVLCTFSLQSAAWYRSTPAAHGMRPTDLISKRGNLG